MDEDADEWTVDRCLEAYLLRLFGWVMFCGSTGNVVDKLFIKYARDIVDAPSLDEVPHYSWGSAVLAYTYRGLTDACSRNGEDHIITGCPLLLQIWSHERMAVGRPIIHRTVYGDDLYGDGPIDGPTMGTLWCRNAVGIT